MIRKNDTWYWLTSLRAFVDLLVYEFHFLPYICSEQEPRYRRIGVWLPVAQAGYPLAGLFNLQ